MHDSHIQTAQREHGGQGECNTQHFIARFLEIHDTQARSARDELDRLRTLIDDAGERLMSSFSVIGALSESQRAVAPDSAQEIDRAVGEAVNALQFQDMATQLVGHAVQRIELLERITESLGRIPEVSVDELSDALAGTVASREDGPVEQACMTGGAVDLF